MYANTWNDRVVRSVVFANWYLLTFLYKVKNNLVYTGIYVINNVYHSVLS